MMLRLPDSWIWDFWIADTGTEFHLFFLRASRALHDPRRRHMRASVGHAVSVDLTEWTLLPDAIVRSDAPAWDDLAIWTGSVLQALDGGWRMFYTGLSLAEAGAVQRIGMATSTDLMTWSTPGKPDVVSDPRWYEQLDDGIHDHVAWRDPWVFADPHGDGWHMLVTARARFGPHNDRGVLGHAWSPDLETWTVRAPLSDPCAGFSQLEVPQVAEVDGRYVLLFSCLAADAAPSRRRSGPGGIWVLPVTGPADRYDIGGARLLVDDRFYSARLVRDRAGQWQMLAFHLREADGSFGGRLSDPMPVRWATPDALVIG